MTAAGELRACLTPYCASLTVQDRCATCERELKRYGRALAGQRPPKHRIDQTALGREGER